MRQWNFLPILLLALIAAATSAVAQAPTRKAATPLRGRIATREGFSFLLGDYKMEHQGETNLLQIKISYDYIAGIHADQYPDFIPIRKATDEFLTNYPNETTFWEIVNKELTLLLLAKYPALASVTSEITVTPSQRYPFTRGSTVTSTRRSAHR